MVLAPNGKRVYHREGLRTVPLHSIQTSFTNTTPASSRASSVSPYSSLSSPSSSTPSTPSDFSSPATGPFGSRKSGLTTATVSPVYTPFTPSLPVDPAYPYPDTEEITALHEQSTIYEFPAGVDVYPSMLPPPIASSELMSPLLSSSDEDEDMEMSDCSGVDMPASPGQLQTYVCAQGQSQVLQPINTTPKKNVNFAVTPHRGRPSTKVSEAHKAASPSASKSKGKNRHSISGPSASSRRREKLFHCPVRPSLYASHFTRLISSFASHRHLDALRRVPIQHTSLASCILTKYLKFTCLFQLTVVPQSKRTKIPHGERHLQH